MSEEMRVEKLDGDNWAIFEGEELISIQPTEALANRIVRAVNGLSEVTKELRAIIRICNHSEQLDECQKLTSVELASTISNRARKALAAIEGSDAQEQGAE